ncbi:Ig-like domain-containing protein [methane-oxidizing endosymbiont of Gigantopelta aegis]|uniref:Ig-like domain-containing protein n=1 Tax=methane-oxidizing endosymbiont of Gigantopelta aegis TaxID=2794938 RepID=UPI0018DDA88F|nr:Ig-like domain-containing protein [methane-oxidizing endosymbiont of Gigantopelta aegis]
MCGEYSDPAQVNGADAVRAINVSGPQIAAWFDSKVPEAVVNYAPTASDDFAVTKAGDAVDISVLENDVDADQDALSIVEVGTAKHGQVAVNADSIRYAPTPGYVGQDNFQYTITDGQGHNASAWVTVNVGWGAHYQYFEGTWNQLPDFSRLTPVATGISHNFSLESRQRDQGIGIRFHAQILIPATGDYQFDVNTNGLAKVTIDGQDVALPDQPGMLALTAGLHQIMVDFVSVGSNPQMQVGWQGPGFKRQLISSDALRLAEPVNSFPVAADDAVQMTVETQILIDVLDNDNDTDGDILHIAGFTQPDHGSVSQQGDKLLYQPDVGFNGQDVFSYQVSDGRGGEDYGQVTVTVGQGLRYEYYEGNWQQLPDFDSLVPVATGIQNDFSLVNRNRDDHFAFRFRATLKLPQDGSYYFFLISDDGSRLIIDDKTVADLDGVHTMRWRFVAKNYSAGQHDLELQYFDYTGRERLYLFWRGPDMRWQRLDSRYLIPVNP